MGYFSQLLLIAVSTAIVNNVVLSQFLGLCPFLGVSKKINTAAGMGGAVIGVITISSAVCSLIYDCILTPLKLTYLNTIVFILVIAALVQFVEMFLKKTSPSLYEALGVYLPLITTNCAVLGIALTNIQNYNTAAGLNIGQKLLDSVVSGLGTAVGFTIAIIIMAGKKFYVEVDQKEIDVRAELPGNNCGGCGYAGCDALAKAIAAGEAPANACPVGGAPVASKIGAIMGEEVGESVRMTAFVKCAGDCDKAKENYVYSGAMDCTAMNVVPNGGSKACTYGCMGYGSCVKACPFDAIHIVNGIAVVDKGKCKACGKCVAVCPRHLIEIIPYKSNYTVNCSSNDKGKDVMSACSVGCIGCMLCTKQCEFGAITVENNIAHIDYSKCTGCGKCAEKCPKKIIHLH